MLFVALAKYERSLKPMMNPISALLEAHEPPLDRFRHYRLEAGTDLFGAWLPEVTYGRMPPRPPSVLSRRR